MDELEQRILDDPDNRQVYEDYADWLLERGDPRGELMRLQLDLEDAEDPETRERLAKRESELIDAHLETWLGSLAPLLYPSTRRYLEFERGLLHTIDTDVLTDECLEHLVEFPHLRQLVLQWDDELSVWTEAGLANVTKLPLLTWLDIRGTSVTDDGLSHLAGLKRLLSLKIRCPITGEGLKHVAGLTTLQKLHLHSKELEASALAHLAGLWGLWELEIPTLKNETDAELGQLASLRLLRRLALGTRSAGCLAQLCTIRTLRQLELPNMVIGDSELAHVASLEGLEVLRFDPREVTDAGLARLTKLANLRELDLAGSKVTDDGVAELRAALPQTEVYV